MNVTVPGINTKQFIHEIQKRRAIWDVTCDWYTDKEKRKECWDELTLIFMEADSATEVERDRFARNLQRRWKNIRDCYTRQIQRGKLEGGRRGSYIYAKQLTFLDSVVKPLKKLLFKEQKPKRPLKKEKQEEQPINIPVETNLIEPSPNQQIQTTDMTETRSFEGSDPLDIDDIPLQSETDCDRMFLLSLLDTLKEIPEDYRFDVKMEIMRLMQRARNKVKTSRNKALSNVKHEMYMEEDSVDTATAALSNNSDMENESEAE